MPGMARLSQVLAPRGREFFDLFEEAAGNIVRAADLLERLLRDYPEARELAREILTCEHEGDRITHDVIHALNSSFVTPIDREDILQLTSALDDIVDFTEGDRITREAVASLFEEGVDPLVVIRWKDIYERLESAIDATERVAYLLEGISTKNA